MQSATADSTEPASALSGILNLSQTGVRVLEGILGITVLALTGTALWIARLMRHTRRHEAEGRIRLAEAAALTGSPQPSGAQ